MDTSALLNDPNFLPWLIPVGPLLAFLIISLLTNRARLIPATSEEYGGHHPDYEGMLVPVVTSRSRVASITIGFSGVIAALLISFRVIFEAWSLPEFGRNVFESAVNWMDTGALTFNMGVLVDPLTSVMLFMVPIAVLMIFIYSVGYMAHDPRQSRFFALISLFAGAMLILVVADNLLLLFVGWEIMGVCSYMLIGFWFEKKSAYNAAIKAFTTTRVADVIMLLGIAYLYFSTGTLNFRDIMYHPAPGYESTALVVESHAEGEAVAAEGEHAAEPAAADDHGTEAAAAEGEGEHEAAHIVTMATLLSETPALLFGGISAAGLIGIFLIIGTIGKSAQFPLHVWLPDAMEGPTPVSAMIHAAAMVSAGVYAVIRMYPLFEAGGHPHDGSFTSPLLLMAVVGAVTALFAATIAVAQNDVKKVLAYSTISQLGFMVAALGIGGFLAAAFHLITHAFFKALLFMASGSVIHGMEHGEHHVHAHGHGHGHDDGHGHAALPAGAGGGPLSAHLERAMALDHGHDAAHGGGHGLTHNDEHAIARFDAEGGAMHAVEEHKFDPQDMMNMGGLRKTMPVTFITFLIGGMSLAGLPLITAGFWSKDEIIAEAWLGVTKGFGPHTLVLICLTLAAFLTAFYTMRQLGLTFWGDSRTEEAKHANLGRGIVSLTMTLPLIILSFFAVTAGFVGVLHDFPLFGGIFTPGHVPAFAALLEGTLNTPPPHLVFNIVPVLISFAVALGGISVGWLMYWRKPLQVGQPDPLIAILGAPLHTTLKNKYYFDELFVTVFVKPSQWFSKNVAYEFLDKGVIDGFLHLIAKVFTWIGDFIKVMNLWLIDGVGDGVPELVGRLGKWFRGAQTGRIQQYMLLVLVAALLIGVIFALSSGVLQAAP
ncbi:MAG: hypothetical protein IPK19_12000 [Chloroflexi bacterium]|nr:hypothetical protein [Chloroflexota bacterium]